jgi:hypothetical protein
VIPLGDAHDAYGHLLLAAFEGRESHEIMERDDGLVYPGDPSEYFLPYRKWPSHEKRAMRFVRGRAPRRRLRRRTRPLALQDRGHDVVAIDESPLAVEVARRRGVRDVRCLGLADVDNTSLSSTRS